MFTVKVISGKVCQYCLMLVFYRKFIKKHTKCFDKHRNVLYLCLHKHVQKFNVAEFQSTLWMSKKLNFFRVLVFDSS